MIPALRDILLMLAALGVSLIVIWHGSGMLISPRRFLERIYGGLGEPVEQPSRRLGGFIMSLNYRVGGSMLTVVHR